MKTTTISVNVYEVGDVIEINRADLRLVAKQRSLASTTRAIIMGISQRMDKLFTYKIVADNGKTLLFTPGEQGHEKYIGHIDLSLLFAGMENDVETENKQDAATAP